MNSYQWKAAIKKLIEDFVLRYQEEFHISYSWRTPIVGYADANDPYIQNLPQLVTDVHKLPSDFMENPTIVISYFIPFTKELAKTNVGVKNHAASQEWADAYGITNTMMAELNEYLASEIIKLGGRAAVPKDVGMLLDIIKSKWSQRHLAFAAGLGTFGINNMLISKEGCCGRYNSIVADIPVEPEHCLKHEYCLYKSKGVCKKCVDNCIFGALKVDGFERRKCYQVCMQNQELFGEDVCGKCDTDIPCAFTAPAMMFQE